MMTSGQREATVDGYAGPAQSIIGVLGGMGPSATADFMAKLTARTSVEAESDHLPLAVWSNPEVPDRTRALLGIGPSPLPALIDGVNRLLSIGAVTIVIPCNTAHAFLDELGSATGARFLNMIEATMDALVAEYPDAERIGILSTSGTRLTALYENACTARGLVPLNVTPSDQSALVDAAIRSIKIGEDLGVARALLATATERLASLGAEVVIAGCTELPLAISEAQRILPVLDATDCLSAAVVTQMRAPAPHRSHQAGERRRARALRPVP